MATNAEADIDFFLRMLLKDLARHVERGLATGMGTEKIAWLVEIAGPSGPLWLFMRRGILGWTPNANDAWKFADQKSAESLLETLPTARATEHSWPEGW